MQFLLKFYSNLSFKFKFFIVPLLAIFLFSGIAAIQHQHVNTQYKIIQHTVKDDIGDLKSINHFLSNLSIIFGDIHNLLFSVKEKNIDDLEEYVYIHGKPLIYKIHQQHKILKDEILPHIKPKIPISNHNDIEKQFNKYIEHSGSSITMVTVELDLARDQLNNASKYYNELIKSFELAKQSLLKHSENHMNENFVDAKRIVNIITIFIFSTILIMLIIAIALYKQLSQEFQSLSTVVNKLSHGQRDVEIPSFQHNQELHNISIGLKNFRDNLIKVEKLNIEKLQMQEQLLRSEKLASMGEMIGNIAHQWRQPLSVISTAATGIKVQKEFNYLDDEKLFASCAMINDNAQYLSQTIEDFKNFLKEDTNKKTFNLTTNIHSLINLVSSIIKVHNLNLILKLEESIEIDGYPNELIQCMINIFNNSKDALINLDEKDRYLFISTYTKGENAIIEIKDSAKGIPEDILPKIFDPYFTTKHQSRGTGLGLHMTYNLITQRMKGTIESQNTSYLYNGKKYTGASFTITLPL